jgi:hypothetical protein
VYTPEGKFRQSIACVLLNNKTVCPLEEMILPEIFSVL